MVFAALAAMVILEAVYTSRLQAAGYWNVPGTIAQRQGHGFGGGYHAPLILGPVTFDGWLLPNHVRLPYAPAPSCCYAHGCDCGQMIETPTAMEGVVTTSHAPPPAGTRQTPGGHSVQKSLFDSPVLP
jgi:hypothetical protein